MKTLFLATLLMLASLTSIAQSKHDMVQVYTEQSDNGVAVYAINKDLIPYTLELSVQQENLKSNSKFPLTVVLAPKKGKVLIATLVPVNQRKGWSFGSQSVYYRGDINAEHDDDFAYALPFLPGEKYLMSQGYDGPFSHAGKKAVDFTMPEGTKIRAARGGLVVKVKENSNRGCGSRSCINDANFITIYHEDGSFADYVHLKKKGSLVHIGDKVKKGQVIGLSGATGFASGPHLHFEVYQIKKDVHETLATKFEVAPNQLEFLTKKAYLSF